MNRPRLHVRPFALLLAFFAVGASGCTAATESPENENDEPAGESSQALGRLSIDTFRVDLGRVPCSGFRFPSRVSLRNSGSDDVTYRAQFRNFRSAFEVSPASGTVRAGGYEWLDVGLARYSFTPLLPGVIDDDLEITDGSFGFPERVPVRATITGALLRQDRNTIDFGSLPTTGDAVTDEVELRNDGNESVNVNARVLPPFEVSPSSAYVSPGARVRFTVRLEYSGLHGYQTSRVQLTSFSRLCGEAPQGVWVRAIAP